MLNRESRGGWQRSLPYLGRSKGLCSQGIVFYTLTKIHKPVRTGRPIISGCEGPTEKLSAFVDKLLQPIAQQQKSYLKDTTAFINFIERTKVPEKALLVSMDVTSLYTNIPQEEGI